TLLRPVTIFGSCRLPELASPFHSFSRFLTKLGRRYRLTECGSPTVLTREERIRFTSDLSPTERWIGRSQHLTAPIPGGAMTERSSSFLTAGQSWLLIFA